MRAATEGSLPPVMPQGNLVEVLGREVRQGSPGELMVESSPSRQRRPPCKTNKEMSDEAADAAALTYSLTPITCLLCFSSQMMASNLLMTAYTSDVTTPTATASFLARLQREIRECEPYSANGAETSMRVSPTSYSSSSGS